jgi:hypothetical protein
MILDDTDWIVVAVILVAFVFAIGFFIRRT